MGNIGGKMSDLDLTACEEVQQIPAVIYLPLVILQSDTRVELVRNLFIGFCRSCQIRLPSSVFINHVIYHVIFSLCWRLVCTALLVSKCSTTHLSRKDLCLLANVFLKPQFWWTGLEIWFNLAQEMIPLKFRLKKL